MSVFRKTQYGGREVRPGGKEASPRGVGEQPKFRATRDLSPCRSCSQGCLPKGRVRGWKTERPILPQECGRSFREPVRGCRSEMLGVQRRQLDPL